MAKKETHKQDPSTEQSSDDRIIVLEAEIAGLTKQLADKEEIAKRAQSDYIRLKMDMDSYVTRTEAAQKDMKVQ
jgi:molecular chaperone GrpE (heat shock protein)